MAHQAGAYPSFCSMKRLGAFLLPPGWDDSPSQGYPPALSSPVHIYTPGWREALWKKSVLLKNRTQCPRPGLASNLLQIIAVSYHFRHRCSVCLKRSHQKGTRHKVSRKRNKRNVIYQHYFPLLHITITVSNKSKSRNQLVKAPYSPLHCDLIFRTLPHNI